MSQKKITLPVTLDFYRYPTNLVAVSRNAYLRDPDATPLRYARGQYGKLDPWELREAFLTCAPEDWERFLATAGSFSTSAVNEHEFAEWQALLREALVLSPNKWQKLQERFDPEKVAKLLAPLPMEFEWAGKAPCARIVTMRSLHAIIATIQLDLLQGAKFRVCELPDCKEPPFKLEDPRKRFCSYEHAHLAAVRRSRAGTPKSAKKGGK